MKPEEINFGDMQCMDPEEEEKIRKSLDTFADAKLRIATILGFMGKAMKTRFDRELERTGLTITQMQVIFYIARQQRRGGAREITARELETRFRVSNPTMSGILRRLEKKGLIERMPGRLDKRNKQIRLREDLDGLCERVEERIVEERERLFEGFTEEELAGLSKSLRKLLHNLEHGEE